jgi:hypothetical protein
MASNWTPDVLPQLRIVALLYDQVERGEYRCATELRYWRDGVGVTFMGTQDRRWSPPKVEDTAIPTGPPSEDRYSGLKVIGMIADEPATRWPPQLRGG